MRVLFESYLAIKEMTMLITETTTVKREINVAPCLECGHADILLSDCNYSSFNHGGGECKKCGHKTYAGVGCNPTMDQLAAIWNAGNDIPTLIRAEEAKIAESNVKIQALRAKTGDADTAEEPKSKGFYRLTPKNGGEPFISHTAPDSWELRECDIEWVAE